MDRPALGSVKRARERAAAGLPREAISPDEPRVARPSAARQPGPGSSSTGLPRGVRPQAPFPLQTKDGQVGVSISKPIPAPQWPLPGPAIAPAQVDGTPFRPPPGTSQPPQRPPRPSRVPSILDASKVQEHTPVFQYTPQPGRESGGQEPLGVPETPSSLSRRSTLSSVGSIPDFPLPIQGTPAPSRRTVNLGPPPSARRGASSFYSNPSFVSPIPEESPHSRSHASYASSAAMPGNWGSPSPGPSPDFPPDAIYGEAISEERGQSPYGEDDTDQLVRSASIGKRARPTLVSAAPSRGMESEDRGQRPGPQPIQGPFKDGTGYVDASSSSGTVPSVAQAPIGSAVTADTMLNAYSSASAGDPSTSSPRATPSPNPQVGGRPYSRLSAIRRPPPLDIDSVRRAEARGSMTSLPDLIRRATRLAASLEKGRRPASRFDDLDDSRNEMREDAHDRERHRSGLSDMLAAFPPPAHLPSAQNRRSIRDSMRERVQSWPLPINFNRALNTSQDAVPNGDSQRSGQRRRRRCCGLPIWGCILMVAVILILVAAAVALPVYFFVIRNQDAQAQNAAQQCQQQLTCANGGRNVVTDGKCSCICANGFTGSDCTTVDTTGCTMISLTGSGNNDNVTIGDAIPRLIQQAQANFSIPLSANEIIAKLNAGNLSCSAENALVTFNGRSTRQATAPSQAAFANSANAAIANGIFYTTITVVAAPLTTFTLWPASSSGGGGETTFSTSFTSSFATTLSVSRQPSPATSAPTATSKVTTTMTMSSGTPLPTSTSMFTVTEDVLDFARVAVLYILQEDNLADAETAQTTLQKFFSSGDSVDAARNVTVVDGKSVDLVDFVLDMGGSGGKVGRVSSVAARGWIG
ncbi:hypothetical protein C8A03DRAFT_32610 [Achaetomium macrosporum]|uniref:EGF-like domain-containing protein n=1 Tax=Achaetomium macrosporum TaxID=79813 RepID=A0AAN7CCC3_9PEZI|nr:hypothetical protein C8A03DRAFT_32610 [Achaetomium macrosporum]